jgi:hypothetical protein
VEYAGTSPRAKLSAMERDETFGAQRRSSAHHAATHADASQERRRAQDDGAQLIDDGAQLIRLWPLRVLVVSAHEPFRAASAMLIGRRDCTVFSLGGLYGAADLIARERIDVVVVDGAEQSRALADELAGAVPPVAVVSVGEAEDVGLPEGPMLARWTPFEDLFDALVRADRARVRGRTGDAALRRPAGGRTHSSR